MHLKRIISVVLAATVIFQSFAFAVEKSNSPPIYIANNEVQFDNFNNPLFVNQKSDSDDLWKVIETDDSVDFLIKVDEVNIKFNLEKSYDLIKEKLNDLKVIENDDKRTALENLYSEILFVYDFYEDIQPDEYENLRWSILYNLLKYTLIDYEQFNNSEIEPIVTKDEIEIIANKLLDIKTEEINKDKNISDERLKMILEKCYSNLKTSVDLKDVEFIEFVDKKLEIETPVVNDSTNNPIPNNSNNIYIPDSPVYVDVRDKLGKDDVQADYVKHPTNNYVENNSSSTSINKNNDDKYIDEEYKLEKTAETFLIYVDYKDGTKEPLDISVVDNLINFEKEKKIIDKFNINLKEHNMENITDCIADSTKLMVSTNGKLLISEFTTEDKSSESIKEFYQPIGIDLGFEKIKI